MLDQTELVFSRLKQFNLEIKLKNAISLTPVYYFWAMSFQPTAFQQTDKRLKKEKKLVCS